jgi:hypothetical protein
MIFHIYDDPLVLNSGRVVFNTLAGMIFVVPLILGAGRGFLLISSMTINIENCSLFPGEPNLFHYL